MSKGIVKSSEIIRTSLQKRIKELNLSLTAISLDAKKRNYKISIHSLSRFFGQSDKNARNQRKDSDNQQQNSGSEMF